MIPAHQPSPLVYLHLLLLQYLLLDLLVPRHLLGLPADVVVVLDGRVAYAAHTDIELVKGRYHSVVHLHGINASQVSANWRVVHTVLRE